MEVDTNLRSEWEGVTCTCKCRPTLKTTPSLDSWTGKETEGWIFFPKMRETLSCLSDYRMAAVEKGLLNTQERIMDRFLQKHWDPKLKLRNWSLVMEAHLVR